MSRPLCVLSLLRYCWWLPVCWTLLSSIGLLAASSAARPWWSPPFAAPTTCTTISISSSSCNKTQNSTETAGVQQYNKDNGRQNATTCASPTLSSNAWTKWRRQRRRRRRLKKNGDADSTERHGMGRGWPLQTTSTLAEVVRTLMLPMIDSAATNSTGSSATMNNGCIRNPTNGNGPPSEGGIIRLVVANNKQWDSRRTTVDGVTGRLVRCLGWIAIFQTVWTLLLSVRAKEVRLEELVCGVGACHHVLAMKLLSRESIEAMKTIQSILADVHLQHGVVDVFGKYRTYDVLAAVIAFNRLQSAALAYERTHQKESTWYLTKTKAIDSGTVTMEAKSKQMVKLFWYELIQELAHYAVYANASYGWPMDLAMRGWRGWRWWGGEGQVWPRLVGLDRQDILAAEWHAKANRPAYFCARDCHRQTIVLCIRGTWSAHDLLTDLCCTPQEFQSSSRKDATSLVPSDHGLDFALLESMKQFCSQLVTQSRHRPRCGHRGMLEAARAVQTDAEAIIAKALNDNPGYSLVLVGHSLGGGCAAMLGTLLEQSYPDLRVYVFGAPCVAPIDAKLHPNIVSVVVEGDPFSCLSLGHVADVSIGLASLIQDPLLRHDILWRTNAAILSDADQAWCFATMEILRKQMTSLKLFPPGRILFLSIPSPASPHFFFWRKRGGEPPPLVTPARLRDVSPLHFRELVLGPRMIDLSRHLPSLYATTLRVLADSYEYSGLK